MAAASALPCINHSVPEGVVNLIQVAGVATGDSRNAGRDAARAVAVLDLQQKRARVDGKGKEVLVGSYEDALKVAEYLGASHETMDAIRAALKKMPGASGASGASIENGANEVGEMDRDDILQIKEISEESARRLVLPALEIKEAFPVRYDEHWAAYMGYSRYDVATDRIKALVNDGDLIVDTDVRIAEERVLSTGNMRTVYYFSVDGIKLFFMAACTPEARKFRMYFVKIEKEYNKVLPELEKLQEENERLRKEKEIISDYQRWRATGEDGIKAHYTAMDNLKHIVQGIEGTGGAKLYAIVNDAINKAVLDFEETTRAFKKAQGYSKSLSVPDILDDLALKERQSIVERFTRYFAEKKDVFCELDLDVVIRKVKKFAQHQRAANAAAGDLKNGHLLSNSEAKKRKRDRENDVRAERIAAANPQQPPQPQPMSITMNATNATVNNITINNSNPRATQRTISSFFAKLE